MDLIKAIRGFRWKVMGRRRILKQISSTKPDQPLCIMIGSGGADYPGWIKTDLPHFDITLKRDWEYFFSTRKIDHLLAEHVLEHLHVKQVRAVLEFAFLFLKPGGTFRIAVPDGLNPDPVYHDDASPEGKVGKMYGHLSLWNYKNISENAVDVHFQVRLLEYFREDGSSFVSPFGLENGRISRTGNHQPGQAGVSLIVDLVKS